MLLRSGASERYKASASLEAKALNTSCLILGQYFEPGFIILTYLNHYKFVAKDKVTCYYFRQEVIMAAKALGELSTKRKLTRLAKYLEAKKEEFKFKKVDIFDVDRTHYPIPEMTTKETLIRIVYPTEKPSGFVLFHRHKNTYIKTENILTLVCIVEGEKQSTGGLAFDVTGENRSYKKLENTSSEAHLLLDNMFRVITKFLWDVPNSIDYIKSL
jgi:hypothetical protein